MDSAVIGAALTHLQRGDPVLGAIIQRVGPCAIQYRDPDFETLVRSIVYQQISGHAALSIFTRLRAATCADGGRMNHAAVLALDAPRLRLLGLSQQKATYLRDLAEKTAQGRLDFTALAALPDQAVIDHLTQVKGVGVWTAQMFLIFALRRPDVLPVSDLGIRAAVIKAYRLRKPVTAARLERIAKPWRPYASVASWYLWRSLENFAAL